MQKNNNFSVRMSLVALLLTIVFSKEYLLLNDNLVIIFVFATIFIFIVSSVKSFIVEHMNNVRLNLFNDYSAIFKEDENLKNFLLKEKKLILEIISSLDTYLFSTCDLALNSYKASIQ